MVCVTSKCEIPIVVISLSFANAPRSYNIDVLQEFVSSVFDANLGVYTCRRFTFVCLFSSVSFMLGFSITFAVS